jgi:hypothetical protein
LLNCSGPTRTAIAMTMRANAHAAITVIRLAVELTIHPPTWLAVGALTPVFPDDSGPEMRRCQGVSATPRRAPSRPRAMYGDTERGARLSDGRGISRQWRVGTTDREGEQTMNGVPGLWKVFAPGHPAGTPLRQAMAGCGERSGTSMLSPSMSSGARSRSTSISARMPGRLRFTMNSHPAPTAIHPKKM